MKFRVARTTIRVRFTSIKLEDPTTLGMAKSGAEHKGILLLYRNPVSVLECLKDNRVHLQLLKAVKTYSIVLKTAEYTYSFAEK